MKENANLVLVLGGARSGKSVYAESLITLHEPLWVYVATAQAFDQEMQQRIALHQARRKDGWQTVEAPHALPKAIHEAPNKSPLLIDCLGVWVSNRLMHGADLAADRVDLCAALSVRQAPTVVVSPEVGLSIVPENPLARAFRDAAGQLHQDVARIAKSVRFIVAGYPVIVK